MKQLTIFTPTFNREKLLKRTYDSLKAQSNPNFVWLIVDDGSTDDTEKTVSSWIRKNSIEIRYVKKENGGKHTAYNLACQTADTELLMVSLDSDDILTRDAVEIVLNAWNANRDKEIVGIVGLKEDLNSGKFVYQKYDHEKLYFCSLQRAFAENLFLGEAMFVFQTEYVRQFVYPVIPHEKFFTEGYTYYQMDRPMLWLHEGLERIEYQQNGLSRNVISNFYHNPVSYFLYNKVRLKYDRKLYLMGKHCTYYIGFGLLGGQKRIVRDSSRPFLTAVLYPLGLLFVITMKYIKIYKGRKL